LGVILGLGLGWGVWDCNSPKLWSHNLGGKTTFPFFFVGRLREFLRDLTVCCLHGLFVSVCRKIKKELVQCWRRVPAAFPLRKGSGNVLCFSQHVTAFPPRSRRVTAAFQTGEAGVTKKTHTLVVLRPVVLFVTYFLILVQGSQKGFPQSCCYGKY
jgi:hypothetical protein